MIAIGQQSIQLLPFQAAFVQTATDPNSARLLLLRGDVGLGKTTALIAVISRLRQGNPAARILVLCPSSLRFKWLDKLQSESVPAVIIDRYKFREMLDLGANNEIWPLGTVSILSFDFAKQPDIRDTFASAKWDLIVADEAHQFVGSGDELLRVLEKNTDRMVLVTTPQSAISEMPFEKSVAVVDWEQYAIHLASRSLKPAPRPFLHLVEYHLSKEEQSLATAVAELCQVLPASAALERFRAMYLLDALHSSPAALDDAVRRLLKPIEQQATDGFEDEDARVRIERAQFSEPSFNRPLGPLAHRVLQELELGRVDSKLNALVSLLDKQSRLALRSGATYVLTRYLSTLHYLAAAIEDRGFQYLTLRGGMTNDDWQSSITRFWHEPSIMVATHAAIREDQTLANVTDLILYDLPNNEFILRDLLAQFDRFGRHERLDLHVFLPTEQTSQSTNLLKILRQLTDRTTLAS
jgi:SNF2 family DNA or RNA helicase